MIRLGSMSPLTRVLFLTVIVSSIGVIYFGQRIRPHRARMEILDKRVAAQGEELARAEERVAELRSQTEAAAQYATVARAISAQTTGRSLRDLIQWCGRPESGLVLKSFTLRDPETVDGARQRRLDLSVEGSFERVLVLLHELERSFPPVEVITSDLHLPEHEETRRGHDIVAELTGVLHETQ